MLVFLSSSCDCCIQRMQQLTEGCQRSATPLPLRVQADGCGVEGHQPFIGLTTDHGIMHAPSLLARLAKGGLTLEHPHCCSEIRQVPGLPLAQKCPETCRQLGSCCRPPRGRPQPIIQRCQGRAGRRRGRSCSDNRVVSKQMTKTRNSKKNAPSSCSSCGC